MKQSVDKGGGEGMLPGEQSPGASVHGRGCTGCGQVVLVFSKMSLGVPCALHR